MSALGSRARTIGRQTNGVPGDDIAGGLVDKGDPVIAVAGDHVALPSRPVPADGVILSATTQVDAIIIVAEPAGAVRPEADVVTHHPVARGAHADDAHAIAHVAEMTLRSPAVAPPTVLFWAPP